MNHAKHTETFILSRASVCGTMERKRIDKQYIRSRLPSAGCKMGDIHAIASDLGNKLTKTLTEDEIRSLLSTMWKSATSWDVMAVCLSYFYTRKHLLTLKDWRAMKPWAQRIDNWAHSDTLSGIYASLLERYPTAIYSTMREWNTSKNAWLRRLSLTSLLYYSGQRKLKPLKPSKILPLVKTRLRDPDAYVQKAVGWTLRETHNLYPKETRAFIETHIGDLSSIAFSYATEKWESIDKNPLKEKRKLLRKI